MPEGPAAIAMGELRTLFAQIDESVEAMLDAHGFSFAGLNAGADHAQMTFNGPAAPSGSTWQLAVTHSAGGELMACLTRSTGTVQAVRLTLAVGPAGAPSLSQAVALGVSFVGLADSV